MARGETRCALVRPGSSGVPLAVVRVASTWSKRAVGLLGQRSLAPGDGMYLAPCRSVHTMGMRFSLDLVFVDRALSVVQLAPNLAPWRVASAPSAHGTIELAAGSIARHNLRVGDQLSLDPVSDMTFRETLV